MTDAMDEHGFAACTTVAEVDSRLAEELDQIEKRHERLRAIPWEGEDHERE